MTEPITTTAANASAEYLNASTDMVSGFGDSFGLALPVVAIVLAAMALVFIGSSVQRIEWLHEKLKAFSQSLYYTAVGVATTVVLAVFAAPVYLIAQADGETRGIIGVVAGAVVLGYVVFTALGWVVDRTVMANLRAYVEQQEGNSDA